MPQSKGLTEKPWFKEKLKFHGKYIIRKKDKSNYAVKVLTDYSDDGLFVDGFFLDVEETKAIQEKLKAENDLMILFVPKKDKQIFSMALEDISLVIEL